MNFLAHLHLSGSNEEIVVGNFMGDFVKGVDLEALPNGVQRGIGLHRLIDDFTDHHPVVEQSKERLRPMFHKYAPVVCDIYYDHFLARDWEQYAEEPLRSFADRMSELLKRWEDHFPYRAQRFLHYMRQNDILVNYGNLAGIDQVFAGMSYRSSFPNAMGEAAEFLGNNLEAFAEEFRAFYPDLQRTCADHLATLR